MTDPDQFGHQPDWLIFQYLSFYEKHRQMQANMDALTAAKGWSGLFSSLASKGSPPVRIETFLPYPQALREAETGSFDDKTARLLQRLMKEKVMPPALMAALQQIPQLEKNGD